MISLPIVDSHVHLWDPASFHLDWLHENPLLNHRYSLEEFQQVTEGVQIEAIICVEANVAQEEALLEARWLATQAQHDSRIQGIVAFAPIEEQTYLASYLDTLMTIDSRIKGVRRNIQGETYPGFCLQSAFVQGVQLLARYNLSFDLCVTHDQLPDVIELVRRCPNTRFLLDHLAKPAVRDALLDPWHEQIKQLAEFPNIACKISGLVTEADYQHWKEEDILPYVTHTMAVFGEDRVLFGSDWPVVVQAASYARWVQMLVDFTAPLSVSAQRKLWTENTRHWYRLEP